MEKWLNLKTNLYPGDEFLEQEDYCVGFKSFNEYRDSDLFGDPYDKKLHLGLSPVPYIGNLKISSVYLLLLNPGLNPGDYIQDKTPEFQERYINNLQQKANEDFPFYHLNPILCSHPGYNYWIKKLKDIIEKIKTTENISWLEAQKKLSNKIAVLELIPYHSMNFGLRDKIIDKLASTRDIKRFVKEKIVPKARNNKCVIIVTRSSKRWDIKEEKNIIVYNNAEARGGSLGKNTRGYKEIINHLNCEF